MQKNASKKSATRDTPDTQVTPVAPAKSRRSWFRRFIILLGCLMVLISIVSYMTRPARLNRVLVDMLESSIGCEATLGKTHLTWDGLLTIDSIDLAVPDAAGEMAQLMHTDRVAVQLRLWPLVFGQVRAASVGLSQPTVYLTEDIDLEQFNYEMLLSQPPGDSGGKRLPDALPEVSLNGGEFRFGQVAGGEYQVVQLMQFDGTLRADPDRTGGYHFELNPRESVDDSAMTFGPSIEGEIDLQEPMVEVRVNRFSFDGPYRYLLPQAMRRWWDSLSPQGELPSVVFKAKRGELQQVSLSAEMELDAIGMVLPMGGERPLLLTGVTGGITLASGEVLFTGLTGDVEGIGFSADGRIDALNGGTPFVVSIETQPFVVPAEGGMWEAMPYAVGKYRERFSPKGTYQVKLEIDQPGAGGELALRGHMDLLDTGFKYYRFPYEATELSGRITFDEDRLVLNDLIGLTPSGSVGVVSGSVGPPLKEGQVDLTIRSDEIPIDENLLQAMKPKHRRVIDMFFSREGYESLLASGVIREPGEGVAAANDAVTLDSEGPVFEPGGSAALTVHIRRPAGPDQKYRVTTDLQAKGLNSVFSFWNYPLTAESGRIVISPDDVTVYDLHMRGLNGGGGVVNGRLGLPRDGRSLQPYLQLTSILLPIDDLLIASMPKTKGQWVKSLQLDGELFGTGEVFADSAGKVIFTVDARLRDGSARPNGGRYLLKDVQGSVTVERTRIQFEEFTGWNGGSSITLNGQADFGKSGLGVDLTFIGDKLLIDPGLIDLVPPGHESLSTLNELFDTYNPDGMVDARLVYLGGRDEPDEFSLDIQPKTLGFDYHDQRVELSSLSGHVELTSSQATLHSVAGRFAAGSFTLDGDARFGDDSGLALLVDVDADRIDATVRALLPRAVLTLVDKLALQGPFVMSGGRLLTWPGAEQGPTAIFEAKVGLHDATAQIGVPITEMDADLDVHIVTFADQAWPHTDVQLKADRLRASDRLIQRLSLRALTGEQPSVINLDDVKGTVYGGTLIGHGQLQLGPDPSLGFDLTLLEVELEPFLKPLGDRASVEEDEAIPDSLPTRDMSSGLLSAGLSIRVPVDDAGQPEGRGIVTVRDARLYDRPLTLALLQAANLALPSESSFDRASARFVILGDTVLFDDIRFEAPAFVISGTGTMAYPSTALNLRMVTHNPEAPNLGPVTELVRTFKDELLGIEVRGTLAEPVSSVVPLDGVFRSWGKIFGNKRAQVTDVSTEEPEVGQ